MQVEFWTVKTLQELPYVMDEKQLNLFEMPKIVGSIVKFKQIRYPIWTENKARLIAQYLYYFVLITTHGTYINGFAGPQSSESPESWAAKLVMESDPRWLGSFFL